MSRVWETSDSSASESSRPFSIALTLSGPCVRFNGQFHKLEHANESNRIVAVGTLHGKVVKEARDQSRLSVLHGLPELSGVPLGASIPSRLKLLEISALHLIEITIDCPTIGSSDSMCPVDVAHFR